MRRADATRVYYALQVLASMPTWVVMAVYLVQELDLSALQLVLMGTAMEGAVFLFELRVPVSHVDHILSTSQTAYPALATAQTASARTPWRLSPRGIPRRSATPAIARGAHPVAAAPFRPRHRRPCPARTPAPRRLR